MELDLEVRGLDEASEDVEDMADRAEDLTPAMEVNADTLLAFIAERFATRTAPDGTPWAPLKGKSESTGALEGSIYANPSTDNVAYGSDVEHAIFQQAQRPFLPSDEDTSGPALALMTEIEETIADHVAPEAEDTR